MTFFRNITRKRLIYAPPDSQCPVFHYVLYVYLWKEKNMNPPPKRPSERHAVTPVRQRLFEGRLLVAHICVVHAEGAKDATL